MCQVSERLEAFKSVTIQDLSDLCPRFFAEGAHVEAGEGRFTFLVARAVQRTLNLAGACQVLALGNLTSEDAKQLSKQLVKAGQSTGASLWPKEDSKAESRKPKEAR